MIKPFFGLLSSAAKTMAGGWEDLCFLAHTSTNE